MNKKYHKSLIFFVFFVISCFPTIDRIVTSSFKNLESTAQEQFQVVEKTNRNDKENLSNQFRTMFKFVGQ